MKYGSAKFALLATVACLIISDAVPSTMGPRRALADEIAGYPPDETTFIGIVDTAMKQYSAAESDFQKGALRPKRAKSTCSALKSTSITGWVGTLDDLSTTSDGKGVISIKISNNIHLNTWNNAFSDIIDSTLVEPDTALYDDLGALKKGDKVIFSGNFIQSDTDCFEEGSFTLDGSLSDPAYIVKFLRINSK